MLAIIGKIGTAGGTGYTIEFAGSAIRALSMEGRMTVCNMAIEAGARAGLVAVDETTIAYVKGRPFAPERRSSGSRPWPTGARCTPTPTRTSTRWSSSTPRRSARRSPGARRPRWWSAIDDRVPDPENEKDAGKRDAIERALRYMGLEPNKPIADIRIDKVFIGSCTNSRIEDLREAAAVVRRLGARGRRATSSWRWSCRARAWSRSRPSAKGLDEIFKAAGFEWREPGCSMCLAMNADRLEPGERCASTSNRNFEGRQGAGGRTHLVSPAMAAAAAIEGHFVDVRRSPDGAESWNRFASTPAWSRRWTARTSTPTRSSRSSS